MLHADELQGRQSGSEAWRTERGEIGQNPKSEVCAVPTSSQKLPATSSPPSVHTQEVFRMDSTNVNNNLQLDRFITDFILLYFILFIHLFFCQVYNSRTCKNRHKFLHLHSYTKCNRSKRSRLVQRSYRYKQRVHCKIDNQDVHSRGWYVSPVYHWPDFKLSLLFAS